MKLRRGIALGVGLLTITSWIVSPLAQAITATPTVVFKESPLLITAYQRTIGGLQFVQLYNDGDEPLNVADWKITNESAQPLGLGGVHGWLTPKAHIIASMPGIVGGASASITSTLPFGTGAKLSVVPPAGSGYKQVDYELKAVNSSIWKRTTTTTGYSSSTTSFTATGDQALFDDGWYETPTQPQVVISEIYPYASDCSPHDVSVLCGDYVKLHNPMGYVVSLDNYVLRSDSSSSNRTSSNTFSLDGVAIPAGGYHTVWLNDDDARISLTNSGGYIWLEDAWGLARYDTTVTKYEGAGSAEHGFSWAQKEDGSWAWSSAPQPLSMNVFPVVLTAEVNVLAECPAGKYRNPETNRCRTIEEAVNALAICPEGQYRNPDTNRCKASAVTASASLTPCKEGQERNLATNRCRSIASAVAELIPCDEGYERNPATNRCRKAQALTSPASIAAAQATGTSSSALPWVIGVAALGAVGYGVFEWRHELAGAWTGLPRRFKK